MNATNTFRANLVKRKRIKLFLKALKIQYIREQNGKDKKNEIHLKISKACRETLCNKLLISHFLFFLFKAFKMEVTKIIHFFNQNFQIIKPVRLFPR